MYKFINIIYDETSIMTERDQDIKEIDRNMDKLLDSLSMDDKARMQIDDMFCEATAAYERHGFIKGFKAGAKVMQEIDL